MSSDSHSDTADEGTTGDETTDGQPRDEQPTDGRSRDERAGSGQPRDERASDETASGRRDIVVPMRLYKTITVFSTLIAVVSVVLGFVLIDAATIQFSFLRQAITGALTAVGVPVDQGLLGALLALVGIAIIGFGAGVYVLGTRFRARGMGNSQEDSDEFSDNG
ncbi:DUF7315 family membrane protein [Haloprofundus salilacus]|uniref:DUF7315 family membrane protein n=1 Tax=Haloprofundus salilacus TaxID=2876190 RepID=UPI00295F1197|nr:hypothetical protein [Haloprofundus salilacus]